MSEVRLVSVVMPCLNEAQSVGSCVSEALAAISLAGYRGEVIVVDNGSTDGSASIAEAAGAIVVEEPRRGYGSAYLTGLAAAKGDIFVMSDADGSYDLTAIPALIAPLIHGQDIVLGSRVTGGIEPGAMPFLHRYVGNPFLSWTLRALFGSQVRDCHAGLRAMTRAAYERLELQTTGMEFASEMIILAARERLRVAEVPTRYRRRIGESKLRTFRDGWRHLRLLLMYSPVHLFLFPGVACALVGGLLVGLLAAGPIHIGSFQLDYHSMIAGSLILLVGLQVIFLGLIAKAYSWSTGIDRHDRFMARFTEVFTLERALIGGLIVLITGLIIDTVIAVTWARHGFRNLDLLRPSIVGLTLTAGGLQSVFSAFLLGIVLMPRRPKKS